MELQEKLRAAEAKEADLEVTSVKVREEMKRGYEDEAQKLREQVKQHSLTICAMEERLNKVVKKNKEAQTEVNHLKKTIQGTTHVNVYFTHTYLLTYLVCVVSTVTLMFISLILIYLLT